MRDIPNAVGRGARILQRKCGHRAPIEHARRSGDQLDSAGRVDCQVEVREENNYRLDANFYTFATFSTVQ